MNIIHTKTNRKLKHFLHNLELKYVFMLARTNPRIFDNILKTFRTSND